MKRILMIAIWICGLSFTLAAGIYGASAATVYANPRLDTTGATTERISVASDGSEGNDDTWIPSVTADGRYVVFASHATNLVPDDSNAFADIFLRDRLTGSTTLISQYSGMANDGSWEPVISQDGRYVVYQSYASNLRFPDTNGQPDIFLYDRQADQTTMVSIASNSAQANHGSSDPAISADGRFIVFSSMASNLVTEDTNVAVDVFLHDRQLGQTTLISQTPVGSAGNQSSTHPFLSADGRYVVFDSNADNLVGGDTNGAADVFLRDRQSGQTVLVSKAADGTPGNGVSSVSAISPDGRFVAFVSDATNLVGGDTNDINDVFVYDHQTGQIEMVSLATDGTVANGGSYGASLSGDGHWVVFVSSGTNLVQDDANGKMDIFLRNRWTGETALISTDSDGNQGNDHSSSPAISTNGRYVVFDSASSNLVPGDTNAKQDIFLLDLWAGFTGKVYLPAVLR